MPEDPHKITRERVDALRNTVERFADRRIKTPADFSFLSDAIREKTRQSVSATTLKRIWGYINDAGKEYLPGRYSLCVLARFIGYRDYEDFIDSLANLQTQSATYLGETVRTDSIPFGTLLRITWLPDRVCVLCRMEGSTFLVTEATNCKLCKGDIVECSSFTQNAPLYFNAVHRQSCATLTYVAGSRTGIHYEII